MIDRLNAIKTRRSIDYYVIRDPWVWAVILGLLFLAVCIRWSLW